MTDYKIERSVLLPKEKLHPNPWNPNHMKPRQQEAVSESIQAFGQVLELLVRPHPEIDSEYQILDGEHRFNILPANVYCNVIYGVSDANAKKLTVVMNETRGSADKIELAELLAELKVDLGDELGIGLPYDESELDELINLASVDWDNFSEEFNAEGDDEGGDNDSPWRNLHCKLSQDGYDILTQVKHLIEDSTDLHRESDVAWGQVIEVACKEYLAMSK